MVRGRGRKFWPQDHVGLNDLTSLNITPSSLIFPSGLGNFALWQYDTNHTADQTMERGE